MIVHVTTVCSSARYLVCLYIIIANFLNLSLYKALIPRRNGIIRRHDILAVFVVSTQPRKYYSQILPSGDVFREYYHNCGQFTSAKIKYANNISITLKSRNSVNFQPRKYPILQHRDILIRTQLIKMSHGIVTGKSSIKNTDRGTRLCVPLGILPHRAHHSP